MARTGNRTAEQSLPTISEASNLVYGSGAEADGYTYFDGLRLRSNAAGAGGEVFIRKRLGPSTDTRRGAKDAIFDVGNNTLINDDGSAIWSGGESLVRVLKSY